tara:strand:+ start:534 stop:749 length:216 start_codon:yes stop_codon:yes gene_type:complete
MKIEVGDMILGDRDYGIIIKIEEECAEVQWFDKGDHQRQRRLETQFGTCSYRIDELTDAIDGTYNKLIKAK